MKPSVARGLVLMCLAIVFFPGARVAGQAPPDPFIGTWKLNIAKSTFKPGPAPKSSTARIEPAGELLKVTIDSAMADGRTAHLEWTTPTKGDGKDQPVQGSPAVDTVSGRRVDARTSELAYKKDDKTVQTFRARVSSDGKTMTVTVKGTNAQGVAVNDNLLYVKQ